MDVIYNRSIGLKYEESIETSAKTKLPKGNHSNTKEINHRVADAKNGNRR
jgi:hypothetical protein